ncbi:spidroin-2-like [Hetaerina americana]|uniref:spidroin-2-like n=1 Tax=Hetaerina americana TaxID=62018 RepID=UPI003A7F1F1E
MRLLPSRIFLWVCLLLFITQAVDVNARLSRKEKKKIDEETAPDPVIEEENSEPAASGRDARQHSDQPDEAEGREVIPVEDDQENRGDGAERTKKSYCASGRSHGENYNGDGHPHGPSGHQQGHPGPYGRSDDHYPPDVDQYHGGGRGPGYGPGHPNGYMPHGPDANDFHQRRGHYDGHEGHINPGYARKSQVEYGYGGQGGKGAVDQYHAAASAPSSVYRPSYPTGHESYGGGGSDYSPSYGYGGRGPSYSAPVLSSGGHAYPGNDHYAPHPYAPQTPGYSAGNVKSAYGGGVYPSSAAYGSPGHAYGAPPMYGPMYHGPTGYPPGAGYPSHAAYGPYMTYNAPPPSYQYGAPFPMQGYSQPYGYGSPSAYPPPPAYQMHGPHPGIPVTLTCSLQQHDGSYGYPSHPRGSPTYYRASDNESHPSKPPLTMVMIPANQNKTQKPNEKQPNKDQNDQPIHESNKESKDSHPAMTNQGKPEAMKGGDSHSMMQGMGGGSGGMGGGSGEMGGASGGMRPQEPRESSSYQRMPFSAIRQRYMESMSGPKPIFYQSSY